MKTSVIKKKKFCGNSYQRMNSSEFANFLLTLKDGDVVDFSCDDLGPVDSKDFNPMRLEHWYFAKVIFIPGYDSRFILLDYAGGEEAYAIPLNNYSNDRDDDDERIVKSRVAKYFREVCENLSEDDYVYVEFKEG